MRRQRWWVVVPFALLIAGLPARGADMPDGARAFAYSNIKNSADAKALAGVIDRLVAARWAEAKVEPAPPADDAEFLRRVYLDLDGKVPPVAEARAFLEDRDPEKRVKLVERLLGGPGFANHITETWKGLLLPEADANFQVQYFASDFDAWLRTQFAGGVPYDRIVRDVLTTPLGNGRGYTNPFAQGTKPSPYAFYAAKEGKPENLAAGASRLFLGVRLECAQCHDHPFASWKRDQFWGLAAFFSGVQRQGDGDALFQAREVPDRRELAIPNTERVIQAALLDGSEPKFKSRVSARVTLAEWITAPENPYFAKATVNRVWSLLLGTGLVDPVDDMETTNPPSHPELLDALALDFVAHRFDLKYLIRAITQSRVYGLSSAGYSPGNDDPHLFAKAAVRGMTPRQLYDSFVQATGVPREADMPPFFFGGDSPRKDFLDRFASQDEKPTERQVSILQALTLMNGRLVTDATRLEKNGVLPAVADAFYLDTPEKIEALYLAALSRRPRPDELEKFVQYIERGGPTLNPKKALADVFWALLNSAEFTLNH